MERTEHLRESIASSSYLKYYPRMKDYRTPRKSFAVDLSLRKILSRCMNPPGDGQSCPSVVSPKKLQELRRFHRLSIFGLTGQVQLFHDSTTLQLRQITSHFSYNASHSTPLQAYRGRENRGKMLLVARYSAYFSIINFITSPDYLAGFNFGFRVQV